MPPSFVFVDKLSMYKIYLLIFIISLCTTPLANAQEGEALHDTLQQEHTRADDKEMEVRKLTKQAGNISTRLSDIEDDISTLKGKIRAQEKILNEIRNNEKKTRQSHFDLEKEKEQITLELSGLMKTLWPVHLQNVRSKFEGVESWAMFDRRFNWLSDIYKATSHKLEEARINTEKIAKNLEQQRLLEEEAQNQLAQVNKTKDSLLGSQYSLKKNLRKIRKKRQSVESELSDILSSIEDLKYQLQSQKTKRFSLYKRMLPWPTQGRVIKGYRPNAKPPVRGLIFGTEVGSSVQSVFWGKVVHNDTLRGFGHVVIVYHGYDYYNLYAYLSETHVRNGQEVEKNEPLGIVGYNPKADGPGLYFELRFHQKPINPKLWLTASK